MENNSSETEAHMQNYGPQFGIEFRTRLAKFWKLFFLFKIIIFLFFDCFDLLIL